MPNNRDDKLAARVKGWVYIAEGVTTIGGGLILLGINIVTPLVPWAFALFVYVALLGPAVWFIRAGKRSLDRAREL